MYSANKLYYENYNKFIDWLEHMFNDNEFHIFYPNYIHCSQKVKYNRIYIYI